MKARAAKSGAKRAFDVVVAAALLVLTAPLQAGLVLLVWARLGRPALFRQVRPGLEGRLFTLLKFRSMREAVDASGQALPDALRLTRFGRLLRASSLDELPTLWNVLRGEMSLVGPRPLLPAYLERYSPEQARRHEVRPGITGWAQVHGRNAVAWPQRLALDVWYVDHWSFKLDLSILLRTVALVAARRGVTEEGQATMREFRGER